jgi:hypothetical protein
MFENIKNNKAVAFFQEDTEGYFMYMRQCGMSKVDAKMIVRGARFILKKNSTLVKKVDRIIHENLINIAMIRRKYLNVLRVCFKNGHLKCEI